MEHSNIRSIGIFFAIKDYNPPPETTSISSVFETRREERLESLSIPLDGDLVQMSGEQGDQAAGQNLRGTGAARADLWRLFRAGGGLRGGNARRVV